VSNAKIDPPKAKIVGTFATRAAESAFVQASIIVVMSFTNILVFFWLILRPFRQNKSYDSDCQSEKTAVCDSTDIELQKSFSHV